MTAPRKPVIGLALGSGLYDAAFATLVRLYPVCARNAITGITLIAGFASTVGWPLTQWGIGALGWRGTCLGWAALHLVLGLPLHSWLPRGRVEAAPPLQPAAPADTTPSAAPAGPGPMWQMLLFYALIAGGFYFLFRKIHNQGNSFQFNTSIQLSFSINWNRFMV